MAYSTNGKKPLRQSTRSHKLDRTLQELESAFSDWDSLNSVTSKSTSKTASKAKLAAKKSPAEPLSRQDEELRKKTKKLLTQLRRQISDLT